MCGKYNLIIVLRAEIATTFGSKMVTVSARHTKTLVSLRFDDAPVYDAAGSN